MSLRCPFNTVLINNTCYYNCQGGFEPQFEDPTVCVRSDAPPTGFTKVGQSNSQILKGVCSAPNGGLCPDPTCSLRSNQCLRNCPPNYTDGGLTCIKFNINRQFAQPECPNLYYLPNGSYSCILSPWGITLYVLFIACLAALLYQFTFTGFGLGNSATLNKIHGYLRRNSGLSSANPQTFIITLLFLLLIIALVLIQG